ncbi:hypothetical protein N7495_007576 [Penicillium taxi]|uniref:uncharacterized protein n=1 Tax=Penicillium taxi TaxID=168475 RepID=UPI00254537EE|nr:uncharacterized protein N7495_007576 [Penicillium taxi]KAJ5887535.1 hypothetical protein N7495_007576 [Penicillium taxi]
MDSRSLVHRRTDSTLKTVMRKIFSRKRQSQADDVEERPNESYFPANRRRLGLSERAPSSLAMPAPLESPRNSPLSVVNLQHQAMMTNFAPSLLRTGSLGPHAMLARRRRATLPSVIFSEDESRYAAPSLVVSDPQDDRSTRPDSRYSYLQNPRSKSTDALQDLVEQEKPVDLSTWPIRKPTDDSIPRSASPPFKRSSVGGQSPRPSTGTTVTSITRGSIQSLLDSDQVSLPPNVGNFVHAMQHVDGLTVEQRLNTIEVKMIDLEFAIARMQSGPVSNLEKTKERPSKQPPRHKHAPAEIRRSKISPGYLSTKDHEELPSLPKSRPTSTSTIRPDKKVHPVRPATSSASLSEFNGVSIEQYSTLVTLLRREQTARRTLEGQVASLRDDIRQIQRAALQSMEMGTMYPIRSVDSEDMLRFRRALDDGELSIRDEKPNQNMSIPFDDSDSDWERHNGNFRDDQFTPSKWSGPGRRVITVPMI